VCLLRGTCPVFIFKRILSPLFGPAGGQVVSRRPLTAEARARTQVSPQEVCGGQNGTGTGYSPKT